MPNPKIGDYFSSVTPKDNRPKRPRAQTSPDSPDDNTDNLNMGDGKVGDMTLAQLMKGLSNLLETKLDEKLSKLATKDDMSCINNKIQELVSENEALKEEIYMLKHQGKIAYEKLIDLESRSRRNNLIFKGLQWNGKKPDYREIVRNFCRDVLGCSERMWVNRAHPVGQDGKSIIAHFPDDSDIEYILNQTSKLRGTGYVIHRDFPHEVRVKRSRLVAVRTEIDRVVGGLRMPLVYDHLYVKGNRFTWEDGKLRAGTVNGAQKLKDLFRHDFADFLIRLSQAQSGQNVQPELPISQTYAEAAACGLRTTTPPETSPVAAQGTSTTIHQESTQQVGREVPSKAAAPKKHQAELTHLVSLQESA